LERILSLREKIDEIDMQILRLLKERMEVCKTIGRIKLEHKRPIRDIERENALYARISERASELGLSPEETKVVYRQIIAMSVRVQESE
jgi:chorismate mutase